MLYDSRISLIKLYFSLRKAVRFKRADISNVALINDSALPSVNALELIKA